MMLRRVLAAVALGGLCAPWRLSAQEGPGARAPFAYMSRVDLNALIARLDSAIRSPAYSEPLKQRARTQEAEARDRLENGDFQAGDRILLVVQGESSLTDTFTVRQGHELVLPLAGTISLKGVLHGELVGYLKAQLARELREPRVQAYAMVRVAVDGAVLRPGFYSVPVGALLGDALMAAGGLSPTARAGAVSVERGGREVLSAAAFRQATAGGKTLDQLDVRAGDRFVVPERGAGLSAAEGPVRTLTLLLSIPLTVFAVTRLF